MTRGGGGAIAFVKAPVKICHIWRQKIHHYYLSSTVILFYFFNDNPILTLQQQQYLFFYSSLSLSLSLSAAVARIPYMTMEVLNGCDAMLRLFNMTAAGREAYIYEARWTLAGRPDMTGEEVEDRWAQATAR